MLWSFGISRLAISWCLFTVCIMGRSLFVFVVFKIHRYLFFHWRLDAIADELHCSSAIVYRIQENMFIYDQATRFTCIYRFRGALGRISLVVEKFLITYFEEQPWAYQKEMMLFLWEEWGLNVHRFTIGRLLKRIKWNHKQGRRIESQNENLRIQWFFDLLNVTAKQLVFIDETLFNEIIGWRMRAYAFIDEQIRYHACINRGKTWSVLFAYTTEG